MKLLENLNLQNFLNPRSPRVILIEGGIEETETENTEEDEARQILRRRQNARKDQNAPEDEESEKLHEITQILENPLKISPSAIRFIEKNIDLIQDNAEQRKMLADSIMYIVSIAQTDIVKAIPPRALYSAASSPKIRKIIPVKVREQLDQITQKEFEKIQGILEEESRVESLNVQETASILGLYQIMKKDKTKKYKESIKKIEEKLIKKAVSLANRNLVGNVISTEGSLSTTEELQLWEIRRAVPEGLWANIETSDRISDIANISASELLQKILDNKLKNNPDILLFWETIEDLALAPGSMISLSEDQIDQLHRFITRGNAAALLKAMQGQKVLLPSHLRALRSLKEYSSEPELKDIFNESSEGIDFQSAVALDKKDKKKITKSHSELELLNEKLKKEKEKEITEIMKSSTVTDDQKEEYQNAETKLKNKRSEFDRYLDGDSETDGLYQDLREQLFTPTETNSVFRGVFVQYQNANDEQKYHYATKILDKIESIISKNIEEDTTVNINENEDETSTENNEEIAKSAEKIAQEKLEEIMSSEDNLITRLRQSLDEWRKAQDKKENKEKEILESAFSVENSRIKELKGSIEELRKKSLEKSIEQSELRDMIQYFMDPQKEAESLEEKYIKGLNARIKDHTLHNADIATILEETDTEDSSVENLETFRVFRDRFSIILDRKLEEIQFSANINQSGSGNDRYAPWIKEVEDKIGAVALISEIQADEEFNRFSEIFKNPQVATQAIQGALSYNRSRIMGNLQQKLSSRNEFYLDQANDFVREILNRININHHISTPESVEKLNKAYEKYLGQKNKQEEDVETSHQKIDSILASAYGKNIKQMLDEVITNKFVDSEVLLRSLIHQDPEGNVSEQEFLENMLETKTEEKLLTKEKKKKIIDYIKALRGSARNNRELIHGGHSFLGTQMLNELELQTADLQIEMDSLFNSAQEQLKDIAHTLASKPKKEDKETIQQKTQKSIKKFMHLWDNKLKNEFDYLIDQYKNVCISYTRQESYFTDYFDKYARKAYQNTENAIEKVRKNYQTNIVNEDLEQIRKGFLELHKGLDFQNGAFQSQIKERKENIQGEDITLTNLDGEPVLDSEGKEVISKREGQVGAMNTLKDDLKYFEDEYDENGNLKKSGAEKAEENFKKIQNEFNEKYQAFQNSFSAVKLVIDGDMKDLKDDEFEGKYGQSKHDIQKYINEFNILGPQYKKLWNEFNTDPNFFAKWRKKYEKSSEDRVEALQELSLWNDRKNDLTNITNQSTGLDKWLKDYRKWEQENGSGKTGLFNRDNPNNFFNRLNLGAHKFSIASIYKIIKETIEILDRKTEKKTEKSAYGVGTYIFGDSYVGRFFKNKEEEAEDKRYQEWEQAYGDTELFKVQDYLYRSDDKDEVRGIINLLIKNGWMKWDDPMFLRTLNRLGSPIKFKIPEDAQVSQSTYVELQEKVKKACGSIWSPEIYRQWDVKITNEFQSVRDSWKGEFAKVMAADLGKLHNTFADMLSAWSRGDYAKADPAKFECFISEAFEYGKANGPGDARFYYLIQALAAKDPMGRTLLSMSRIPALTKEKLVSHGYIEFFIDDSSWKKDGKIVPENTPGASKRKWEYEDFKIWAEELGNSGGTFHAGKNGTAEKRIRFFYENVAQSEFAMDRMQRMSRQANGVVDHDDAANYFMGWSETHVMQLLSSKSEGTQQLTHDFWRNFLSGFEVYAREVAAVIQQNDKEYGLGNSDWLKYKEKILKRLGDRLKVAVSAKQVLQGNSKANRNTPLVFTENDWNKHTTYSTSAMASRKFIEGFMGNVLKKHGKEEEYGEALTYEGYKEPGALGRMKDPDKGSKVLKIWGKTEEMKSDETGFGFYNNTTILENVLKEQFGSGGGGNSNPFTGLNSSNDENWFEKAA